MSRQFLTLLFLTISLHYAGISEAATSATQTVTYATQTINSISISGSPDTMTVSTATAGNQPDPATNNRTTFSITSNASSQRITGSISANMPNGVTLAVTLAAPTGATSTGATRMTTTAANLVTGITKVAQTGLMITYTLSATVAAAPQGPLSRTLTYTLGP